ncbi:MAG: GNAT family N-acetyltransferase [Rhizobiaceae bacterium]|nr:MAG: GNAT family N-acetyltransferase [Rhizobiaceae bacterium]
MSLTFRKAVESDLPFIVRLLTEDAVRVTDDNPDEPFHPRYVAALRELGTDPNQMMMVAVLDGDTVGTLQLTFIPGIAGLGTKRCLVEAVHITPAHRSKGLGSQMIQWAITQARERGCGMVQLTSNKKRLDAHRFYERLGFLKSHEGFKYYL